MNKKVKVVKKKVKNNTCQKIAQLKLRQNLIDLIVLRLINQEPKHGYQIIMEIRKVFGVYFGPSTIYPLLTNFEKKGCIRSEWNITTSKPRKIFTITKKGKTIIKTVENDLKLICKTLHTLEPTTTNNNQ